MMSIAPRAWGFNADEIFLNLEIANGKGGVWGEMPSCLPLIAY